MCLLLENLGLYRVIDRLPAVLNASRAQEHLVQGSHTLTQIVRWQSQLGEAESPT